MKLRILRGIFAYVLVMLVIMLMGCFNGNAWDWALTSLSAHVLSLIAAIVASLDYGPETCEYCGNCKTFNCCEDSHMDHFP